MTIDYCRNSSSSREDGRFTAAASSAATATDIHSVSTAAAVSALLMGISIICKGWEKGRSPISGRHRFNSSSSSRLSFLLASLMSDNARPKGRKRVCFGREGKKEADRQISSQQIVLFVSKVREKAKRGQIKCVYEIEPRKERKYTIRKETRVPEISLLCK